MYKIILLLTIVIQSAMAHADDAKVQVHIHLSPAGGFVASTNDIKGVATKKGDGYTAKNIIVDLKTLKTGIELRDKHTQKHLETEKYPEAILLEATGKGGKGTGKIKIHGKEKEVRGTYEIKGSNLYAKFTLHPSDFAIDHIKYMSIGVKDDIELEVTVPTK